MDRFELGPGGPEASSGAKKPKKKTPFNRTYRFDLSLSSESKAHYPEFNWLDLVAKEEEQKYEDKRKEVLDPYASDDEDQLKALAKKFEEKYGGATEKVRC